MDIGFLNACLQGDLEEDIFPWAEKHGFEFIEMGGFHSAYFKVDFIDDLFDILKNTKLKISALGNYKNWLDGSEKSRVANWMDLKSSILTAEALKVPCVTTFVGQNNSTNYRGNLKLFSKEWIPIIEFAAAHNVKIAIENCPNRHEYTIGGENIMFTPGIMGELFMMTRDYEDVFGLNLDPSHLYWQNIDINLVIEEFGDRIFHTHVKDVLINRETLKFEGTFGKNIYSFKIAGEGEINWLEYFKSLKQAGYKGILSIEHEDRMYLGSDEKAKEGILKSKKFVEQTLVKMETVDVVSK